MSRQAERLGRAAQSVLAHGLNAETRAELQAATLDYNATSFGVFGVPVPPPAPETRVEPSDAHPLVHGIRLARGTSRPRATREAEREPREGETMREYFDRLKAPVEEREPRSMTAEERDALETTKRRLYRKLPAATGESGEREPETAEEAWAERVEDALSRAVNGNDCHRVLATEVNRLRAARPDTAEALRLAILRAAAEVADDPLSAAEEAYHQLYWLLVDHCGIEQLPDGPFNAAKRALSTPTESES